MMLLTVLADLLLILFMVVYNRLRKIKTACQISYFEMALKGGVSSRKNWNDVHWSVNKNNKARSRGKKCNVVFPSDESRAARKKSRRSHIESPPKFWSFTSFSFGAMIGKRKRNANVDSDREAMAFGFDTCANVHYVGDKSLLRNFRSIRGISVDGLNGTAIVTGVGTLNIKMETRDGSFVTMNIGEVFYIEGCDANILSSHLFMEQSKGVFQKYTVPITGKPYLKFVDKKGYIDLHKKQNISTLYADVKKCEEGNHSTVRRKVKEFSSYVGSHVHGFESVRSVEVDINYAHMVLCHPSKKKMDYVMDNNLLDGLKWNKDGNLADCYPCAIGKGKLGRRQHSSREYHHRGELIVTDIEGPIGVQSLGGKEYAVHFTDMYSRFSAVYFMTKKSEVGNKFKEFLQDYCDPLKIKVDTIQTDGAGEFTGDKGAFQKLCHARGIATRASSPYCHWENGIAERVILKMMEKSFSVMAQRDLPASYWAMCLHHVYHVENCLPHSAFNNRESPYMRWFEKRPDLSKFHTFGCDVRVTIPRDSPKRQKYVEPPGYIGIYVGEAQDSSGHLVYKPGSAGEKGSIENVGDALCKFFEAYDPNLYLKTATDEVYQKYFHGMKVKLEETRQPGKETFRIAQKFADIVHFGTAKRRSEEPGDFTYDVIYDDGDRETMTLAELEMAKSLFAELKNKDPRSQPEHGEGLDGLSILPGKVTVDTILDHKITVSSFNNNVAVVKVKYYTKSGDAAVYFTSWVTVGALLSYSSDFDDTWEKLSEYITENYVQDSNKKRWHKHLFRFVRLEGRLQPSRQSKRDKVSGRTREMAFLAYEYDPDGDTIHAISANNRKPIFRSPERLIALKSVVKEKLAEERDRGRAESVKIDPENTIVPTSYVDCLKIAISQWLIATEICVQDFALADIGDWVPIKDVKEKIISSRFVYQIKTRASGSVEAFCRWTPRGYEEEPEIHFDPEAVFAGTPQLWALRLIIVHALGRKFKTHHLDFKRAFSHAPIDKTIHVSMPKGYHRYDENGNELCLRLRKSSEGLKQSAANWEKMLTEFLKEEGFEQNIKEPRLWRSAVLDNKSRAVMCVYVDDLYISTNNEEWLKGFRLRMDKIAPHKSLGEVSNALGCEIEWSSDRKTVKISCKKKILELLRETEMEESRPASTPLVPGSKLAHDVSGTPLTSQSAIFAYRSAVGKLSYIMRGSRAEMAHAVWWLACGMTTPTVELQKQLTNVLRYVNGSRDLCLTYSVDYNEKKELDLTSIDYKHDDVCGFSDADHQPNKSCSSAWITYMNAALFWKVRKQDTTSLSAVESELVALTSTGQDVLMIDGIFEFLEIEHNSPTTMFCDSRGAIQNAKHPNFSDRLRHVMNKIFFIREIIESGAGVVRWIPGTLNPADIGTKALGRTPFRLFASFLMNDKYEGVTSKKLRTWLTRKVPNILRDAV